MKNSLKYKLRQFTMDDLEDLVSYANNPKIANNLTDAFPHPYTREDGKKFINMTLGNDPRNIMGIEIEGHLSGGIGIHPQQDIHRKNAELGYWLAEPFWGNGIMTQAIREMVNYAFDHFDIDRIFARPFGSNIGSQKVLEKAGFTFEGKFIKTIIKNDKYEDELFYALRRNSISS